MCPGGSRSLAATCFGIKAIDLVLVGTISRHYLGYFVVCEIGTADVTAISSRKGAEDDYNS